jgi:cyclomaltodextrinase
LTRAIHPSEQLIMRPQLGFPWRRALLLACALSLAIAPAKADKNVSQETARSAPQWLRDGVIYEIFPRDFSPAGNLNGVTARLGDLRQLGVTILWLMPIHPIGEKGRKGSYGSPYSIKDYYAIDPDYGTVDDLKRLVAEAHKLGMKVIMDIVANHTAWDSVMMAHPEFYKHDAGGKILPPVPEWTDVAGLNYTNPELRAYMIAMMKHWLEVADVDGFRCDVASMVPTDFWVQARAELEKVKPGIMMLAEASKPELLVQAFDIDYDWPMLHTLNDVIVQDAPASKLQATWEQNRREFPRGALHMMISDDHDEARAVARYGLRGALAASALMFTLDGVPLLYNGMEVGDATESGDPALFYKQTIFWHPKDRAHLYDHYRQLIRVRKEYPAFWNNNVTWLRNSDERDLVTFLRQDSRDQLLVVINFSSRPVAGSVNLPGADGFKTVWTTEGSQPNPSGLPQLRLNGYEARIYCRPTPPSSSTENSTTNPVGGERAASTASSGAR